MSGHPIALTAAPVRYTTTVYAYAVVTCDCEIKLFQRLVIAHE